MSALDLAGMVVAYIASWVVLIVVMYVFGYSFVFVMVVVSEYIASFGLG